MSKLSIKPKTDQLFVFLLFESTDQFVVPIGATTGRLVNCTTSVQVKRLLFQY